MADIVVFHHALGLTPGVREFADALRAAGHAVHTPDLFAGELPATVDDGLALVRGLGEELDARADRAVAPLGPQVVFAGFSVGASIAQRLAQTLPGARGALLYESCLPVSGEWAIGPWPDGVPVQIHGSEDDEFFAEDLPAARELVASVAEGTAELFLYPDGVHLFTDSSTAGHDAAAAGLVLERSIAFLDRLD